MIVFTKKLGLAAYMKMSGAKIVSCNTGIWGFETDRDILSWQIEYTNSCCCIHDTELMRLRALLKPES